MRRSGEERGSRRHWGTRACVLHLHTKLLMKALSHVSHNALGAYAYADSSVARPGWRAEFESSLMPDNSPMCIQFWYLMHTQVPSAMGELAVTMRINGGSPWYIFYKKGEQGSRWKFGEANINVPGKRYKVRENILQLLRLF